MGKKVLINVFLPQRTGASPSILKGKMVILFHLGPVHTYPDLFENASFFIRIKKYPRPHEERFRKYPRPHEDAATLKLRCSSFDKRKHTSKMPSCDPQRSVRRLWYVSNRCFDVSVFEKHRFHSSTRQHENGVFKKIHSGERFRKTSFSVT